MTNKSVELDNDIELQSKEQRLNTRAYHIGGGIVSLSAAVFLIRDGGITGRNITIMEELDRLDPKELDAPEKAGNNLYAR